MKSVKFERIYQVRADEVGPDKRMKVPSIIKLMQEGSMQNSLDHQFSVWDLEKERISWVLLRKKLNITSYPTLSQEVKLVTYPIMTEKVLASRDFKIYDLEDNLLAYASSVWTLINLDTRRLQRIPERFRALIAPEDENLLESPPSKILKPETEDFKKEFTASWYDTDWNEHVNNIFFVKSMIESTPHEMLKTKSIKELTYHIRAESMLGDRLSVKGEIKDDHSIYSMSRANDEKTVAYADIVWKDRV